MLSSASKKIASLEKQLAPDKYVTKGKQTVLSGVMQEFVYWPYSRARKCLLLHQRIGPSTYENVLARSNLPTRDKLLQEDYFLRLRNKEFTITSSNTMCV